MLTSFPTLNKLLNWSNEVIKQYIMPNINLPWRGNRDIDAVENMLYRHYQEAIKNRNDSN